MKFIANYVIRGQIRLMTGMHIGGIKETVEIGGTDSPVIYGFKETENGVEKVPIIPGSSLKGKIRSLLEMKYAENLKDGKVNNIIYPASGMGKLIPEVFGLSAEQGKGFSKTRIVVRDSFPSDETINKFWKNRPEVLHGVVIKGENNINRITSMADPRFFERVPAGSVFDFETVLSTYEDDDERSMLKLILEGMKLLEDNYLGGHGSRGYGKIKFENLRIIKRPKKYYLTGEGEEPYAEGDVEELLRKL